MKPKQLTVLLFFVIQCQIGIGQEFDENRLTISERQSLVRALQNQKSRHLKEGKGIFYDKVNQLFDKRTTFLIKLVRNNLLITPGEEFQRIQFIFDAIKTSSRIQRKESLILIMRSPVPNAFCVGEGTIAITTGLLESMETEEQITWVLSHELAHYELDHANQHIYDYVERHKALSRRQKQELSDSDKNISLETLNAYKEMAFGLGKFSRIDELNADSLGHLIFRDLDLPDQMGIRTLSKLDAAFNELLPYHIDKLFHFKDYPFQKFWFKNRPSYFSRIPSNSLFPNDSIKSHPEIEERIAKLTSDFQIHEGIIDSTHDAPNNSSYALENLKSAYRSKNYDFLLFLAAKHYQQKEYRNWIVRLVAAALFELYQLKGEPDFFYLVSPFTYQYGKHLTQINNFLHNTRARELLNIGFLFLNDRKNFNPQDESHFYMMWKYARALDDFQLMKNIREAYQQHHTQPRYLKKMR